jgi:hypothetical protein
MPYRDVMNRQPVEESGAQVIDPGDSHQGTPT